MESETAAAKAETAAHEAADAGVGEALARIATLRAWASLPVGAAGQGGILRPQRRRSGPTGAYVRDILSAPPLAERTAFGPARLRGCIGEGPQSEKASHRSVT